MPFAAGEDVMRAVERLIRELFAWLYETYAMEPVEGGLVPVKRSQHVRNALYLPWGHSG